MSIWAALYVLPDTPWTPGNNDGFVGSAPTGIGLIAEEIIPWATFACAGSAGFTTIGVAIFYPFYIFTIEAQAGVAFLTSQNRKTVCNVVPVRRKLYQ